MFNDTQEELYYICPQCGAYLDIDEKCDECNKSSEDYNSVNE